MRSTATVDWQILDCEEDEWQQALASASVAPASMAQESPAQPVTPRQAASHR